MIFICLSCLNNQLFQKTGNKTLVTKRIVEKLYAPRSDPLTWSELLVIDAVGEPLHEDEDPIRRFYNDNFKVIDQLDQAWYDIQYDKRERSWRTCYSWGIIVDALLNARAAYCEKFERMEPTKEFMAALITEIRAKYK